MIQVKYSDDPGRLRAAALTGFFEGWPRHPDRERHLEILRSSYKVWLAFDGDRCVGFINAISDGRLSAFIPLLEVLPDYRKRGIGAELVRRLLGSLEHVYSIDLICDEKVVEFYARLGFRRITGMAVRHFDHQDGTESALRLDTPLAVARSFVDAVNSGQVDHVIALMTDDHEFIDSDGKSYGGRERMQIAWKQYFNMVPDYTIEIASWCAHGDAVMLAGHAAGTFARDGRLETENHWQVPAAWRVVVRGGKVALWQLYVNPEPMRAILERIQA